jgi:hypothetical protein
LLLELEYDEDEDESGNGLASKFARSSSVVT